MRLEVCVMITILLAGCSSNKSKYQKYDVEKGIITYTLEFPLTNKPIEQRIYFSNYGAVEYFEFINIEDFPTLPILKIDSVEHVFVTDSMTIKSERGFDYIFEKLTKLKNSKLSNDELIILNSSDTIAYDKDCTLIEFKIVSTGQKGKAALWKGIPIWIKSEWEKGLFENVYLIDLDLNSKIPIQKTRIMEYVDAE